MNQARIDVIGVRFGVADPDVVHLRKLGNGFPKRADTVTSTVLDVALLDDLVEAAKNLHVTKLSVAVQILVLELFFCVMLVHLEQVLHG